jgi:hypothetical protein
VRSSQLSLDRADLGIALLVGLVWLIIGFAHKIGNAVGVIEVFG